MCIINNSFKNSFENCIVETTNNHCFKNSFENVISKNMFQKQFRFFSGYNNYYYYHGEILTVPGLASRFRAGS